MVNDYLYQELTAEIIHRFYIVYNKLGYGFLEKVYEKALTFELGKAGILVQRQKPINVYYETELVGEYVQQHHLGIGTYHHTIYSLLFS